MSEIVEICRLCLQCKTDEELNKSEIEESLDFVREFTPFVNESVFVSSNICKSCIDNIMTSKSLIYTVNKYESEFTDALKISKTGKVEIKKLHEKFLPVSNTQKQCVGVCRLCLGCIPQPKIYLCENSSNIVDHKMLRNMLEYCSISIDINLIEKPTMCLKCWQHLQVTYAFKKTVSEAQRRIEIYIKKKKFHDNINIDNEILQIIQQLSFDQEDQSAEESEKECDNNEDPLMKCDNNEDPLMKCDNNEDPLMKCDNNEESLMTRIKFEHNYIKSPVETKPTISLKHHRIKINTKNDKHFTHEEDLALLRAYFEVTNNETNISSGYIKKITSIWGEISNKKGVHRTTLQNRLFHLLRNRLTWNAEIMKIKSEVASREKDNKFEIIQTVREMSRTDNIGNDQKEKLKKDESDSCSENDMTKKNKQFSREEDLTLIKSYFEVTENENSFTGGYWKKILDMWLRSSGRKQVPMHALQNRLSYIFRNKLISDEEISRIKLNVTNRNNPSKPEIIPKVHDISGDSNIGRNFNQNESENIVRIKNEPLSDSEDDTFVENGARSSFTPHVKTEPLSDTDSEVDVESHMERFPENSIWDSLPQLERMDIPPLTFRIDEIYSVDEKRAAMSELDMDPNLSVEEVKTCRRLSFKNQTEDGLFKCLMCNFETKCRKSANIHSRWHDKGPKGRSLFRCQMCPYKISNGNLFKLHQKLHRMEDEIPVLLPMCT